MMFFIQKLLLCGFVFAIPAQASRGVDFSYGQTGKVWGLISDVKGAKRDLSRINAVLDENFDSYETAFGRLGFEVNLYRFPGRGWPRLWRVWGGVEGAALGLVQNPVVPELQASILLMGIVETSLSGLLAEDFHLETGIAFGAGPERRLSAVSTDLIDRFPFQRKNATMLGFDIALRKRWRFEQGELRVMARTRETYFRGLGGQVSVALDRELRDLYHQWQLRADYSRSVFSLHSIFGPHPFPSDFLPRIWNRVANTNHWRELGAMAGGGGGILWRLGPKTDISTSAGYYGGYIGGELRWKFSERSRLALITYGIENSSAFKTLGQRVYSLQSYFGF